MRTFYAIIVKIFEIYILQEPPLDDNAPGVAHSTA